MAADATPEALLRKLQSMMNAILLETGKALQGSGSGKTGGKSFIQHRTTVPKAMDAFQDALDDLEADIIRAKSVLTRDLEALQSKRIPAEIPQLEETKDIDITHGILEQNGHGSKSASPVIILEDIDVTENVMPAVTKDTLAEKTPQVPEISKPAQVLSPPSTNDNKPTVSVDTTVAANATAGTSAPGIAPPPESSTDSLFDMTDGYDNNGTSDIDDAMDFLTSTNDNPQADDTEFDISTFTSTQDFSVPAATSANDAAANDDADDLFGLSNNNAGGDVMDLDTSMLPVEEDSFNDMIFFDDAGNTGGGEATFDDDFFGLND